MTRPLPFFATRPDLLDVLEELEKMQAVNYALAGMQDSPVPSVWKCAREIEGLGIAASGNQITEPSYLVYTSHLSVQIETVPQRRGGVLYSVDLRGNRHATGFCPGGMFDEKTIVSGQLGAGTEHPESTKTTNILVGLIRQRFTPIKSYLVGPEAKQRLDGGARLTINALSSPDYDLRR